MNVDDLDRRDPDERIDGNPHQEAQNWLKKEADTRLLKRLASGRNKSSNLPQAAILWGHRRVSAKSDIAVLAQEELNRRIREVLEQFPSETLERIRGGEPKFIPEELQSLDPDRVAEVASEILQDRKARTRRITAAPDGGTDQRQLRNGQDPMGTVPALILIGIVLVIALGSLSEMKIEEEERNGN